MQFGGPDESDEEDPSPYESETHIRVLDMQDRRPMGHEIHGITEPSMHLIRARLNDSEELSEDSRMSADSESIGPLSEIRHRDLSPVSIGKLTEALLATISETPEKHLGFYNSAGPMSLKYHAFQLLPGIGNAKALQMVQLRGSVGWSDFAAVDEACAIDSARLLAERYVKEMEDDAQTPRLLDILVRSEI
jgi:predicted nucleic acid-binding OB-fold protein